MSTGPTGPVAGPLAGIVVVLVRTEGARNAGSVARLCGNFGCALRFVDVKADLAIKDAWQMAHPCEALLDEAPRLASLGAALQDVSLAVATSGKLSSVLNTPPLDVDKARLLLPAPGEKLALVFGNERVGLSLDEAALCPRVLRLPTPGPVDSLNLSHAVAVALTLLSSAASSSSSSSVSSSGAPTSSSSPTRASQPARAALLSTWEDALDARGFYRATTRAQMAPRLRELVDKMDLSERDAVLMRDLFKRLGGLS